MNRAYRQEETRPYWILRLQSIGFIFVAILALIIITLLLVLLPLGWEIAQKWFPDIVVWGETVWFWRMIIALGVMFISLVSAHLFLPMGKRNISAVLPGIIFTLVCWTFGSLAFGIYLEQFADYVSTYAGLAGAMIGLIFLYMLGLFFILGGEINAAYQELVSQ